MVSIRYSTDRDPYAITSLKDVVEMACNQLGIELEGVDDANPRWKVVQREVGKMKRAMDREMTVEELVRVIGWCAREHVKVKTPVGLVYLADRVPDIDEDEAQLTLTIEDAIALELERPDGDAWVSRLSRVRPAQRAAVLEEWRSERWQ